MSYDPIPGPPGPPMPWDEPAQEPPQRMCPEPVEGHEPAKPRATGKSERLKTTVSPSPDAAS
jgi:hypothetical protein